MVHCVYVFIKHTIQSSVIALHTIQQTTAQQNKQFVFSLQSLLNTLGTVLQTAGVSQLSTIHFHPPPSEASKSSSRVSSRVSSYSKLNSMKFFFE